MLRRNVGRWLRPTTIVAVLIVVFSFLAIEFGARGGDQNLRYERLERLGAETTSSDVTVTENSARLDATAPGRIARATWVADRYEWSRMLPRATACKVNLYVGGPDLRAISTAAYVDVSLDGALVRRIRFTRQAPYGTREPPAIFPSNLDVRSVPFAALTAPLVDVFALPPSSCRLDRFDVTIVAKGASWSIDRVGLIAEFTPARPPLDARFVLLLVVAVVVSLLGLVALATAFAHVERLAGTFGLVLAVSIVAVSPLLHDEWDSVIWPRFVDLVTFAGASPTTMWLGAPLWPVITTIFSPLLYVSYAVADHGGQTLTMHLLKAAMALAFVANAAMIGSLAPRRFRAQFVLLMLLAPVGLYEVAGGYRETFAVSLAAWAFIALRKEKFALASFAFALAASISESLIALVALPAALDYARSASVATRVRRGCVSIGTAIATIVVQYLALTPSGFAGHAISTRVVAYRYGGASWFGVADAYHVLPPWVGPQSIAIVVGLFAVLALPLVVVIVAAVRGNAPDGPRRIASAFLGLTAATFLAYRGIDPNDWYALFAVAAATFARYEPESPLPLVLGVLQGLAFYTIVGIADFVDDRVFTPVDRGLFGTLGAPMSVSIAIVNALILALYFACAFGSTRMLFRRSSAVFALLFIGACLASASQAIVADSLVIGAGAVLAVVVYARVLRLAPRPGPSSAFRRGFEAALATAVIAGGLIFAGGDVTATTIAALAVVLAVFRGIAVVDAILAIGSVAFYASEAHFGWVSILGFLTISIVAVATIAQVYRLLDDVRFVRGAREDA